MWATSIRLETTTLVRLWSTNEFTVDSSIRALMLRTDTSTIDTSLIMPFKQRIRLLKRLLSEAIADEATLGKLYAILDRIGGLQHYRDFFVHGLMVRDSNRPETHIYVSRIHWSNPPRVTRTHIRKDRMLSVERSLMHSCFSLFVATAGCDSQAWQKEHNENEAVQFSA